MIREFAEIYIEYRNRLLNYYSDLVTKDCIEDIVNYTTIARAFRKGFNFDDYTYILAHIDDYQQLFELGQKKLNYEIKIENRICKVKIYFSTTGKIKKLKFLEAKNGKNEGK